jgi:hypothetical protein
MTTIPLGPIGPSPAVRAAAVRRGRLLNRPTIGWNALEGVVAVAAGLAAGSVSLVGFGLDSGIEVSAALILAWRLAQERGHGCTQAADRRATRAIAVSFLALATYVGVESTRDLLGRSEPEASIPGIVLAAVSLVVMPVLARAVARTAQVSARPSQDRCFTRSTVAPPSGQDQLREQDQGSPAREVGVGRTFQVGPSLGSGAAPDAA